MLAPKGTSKEIVAKYNAVLNEILAQPSVQERLGKQGIVVGGGTPERLRDFLTEETAKWQKVVKEAGITPD